MGNDVDPLRDIEIIETELILAYLESISKRLERLEKSARLNDKKASVEKHLAIKLKTHLDRGNPLLVQRLHLGRKNSNLQSVFDIEIF